MKKQLIFKLIGLFVIGQFLGSCKKEITPIYQAPNTNLKINWTHSIDGVPLTMDTIMYVNQSGSKYSVTRCQYYLSGFELTKLDGSKTKLEGIVYGDARQEKHEIKFNGFPAGTYTGIEFLIGLAPDQNISNSLESTEGNINMAWPDVIGGGYHFLKFEGYYLDTSNLKKGFTMHIGTNDMLIHHQKISYSFTVNENENSTINLNMNLNEWFKNPYTYNFNKDGNYTMAIPTLMTLLKNNGSDVFSIKE